jgi:uncharacterized protein (DUF305 family)
MNLKSLLIGGLAGLVVGIIISPLVLGGVMDRGTTARDGDQAADIDRHFIEDMIPHHEGAIAMAQIALEKAQHAEIKSLAQNIITAQQHEITEMKNWYKEWYGTDVPAGEVHTMDNHDTMQGHSHMDSMSGDMEKLKAAKDFDQEFIRQMIPHHEMAVVMAQTLKHTTSRQEMKLLADNILTSQSHEIEMMRSWANTWSKQP